MTHPVFTPLHYHKAVLRGLTHAQQMNNIDERARQLCSFIERSINGHVLWDDLDPLFEEARAIKAYRKAFVTWSLDGDTSPLNEKRETGCSVCHGIHEKYQVDLRWITERTYPILVNDDTNKAVARITRPHDARIGFRWEIFAEPQSITGSLHNNIKIEDGALLTWGHHQRRLGALTDLLAELDGRSIGLFGSETLDVPKLTYDTRFNHWRTIP